MAKESPLVAAAAGMWIASVCWASASGNVVAISALVAIARRQAAQLDGHTRTQQNKAWEVWLHGDGEKRGLQPTKRAFLYVRGAVGWTRSPLAVAEDYDEAIPCEDIEVTARDVEHASFSRVWSASAKRSPLCDQAAVEHEADAWADQWLEGGHYPDCFTGVELPPPLPLVNMEVRRAANAFPIGSGVGGDNIAPRAIARLSDRLLEWLCLILMAAEVLGDWPAAWRLVMIVLIPKPDGGRRPIGLFPTPIRIWMRARAAVARQWEARNAMPCFFGGAGMGAQRAAWSAAFRAEEAAATGMYYLQALLDLVKAFERLPHELIVQAAVRLGYCLRTLRLSLAAYRLPRVLGADGAYSRLVIAVLGITAGSGFATSELRVLLHEVITSTLCRWPLAIISLYVDDTTIEVAHRSQRVAQATLAAVTDFIVDKLQVELRLGVSAAKSLAIGSSLRAARAVAAACRTKALTAVRAAKMLGVGTAGGRRRSIKVLKSRIKAFRKRVPRIHDYVGLALMRCGSPGPRARR